MSWYSEMIIEIQMSDRPRNLTFKNSLNFSKLVLLYLGQFLKIFFSKCLIFIWNVFWAFKKGWPPKTWKFSKKIILHYQNLKIFTLSKCHSPMWWNGWNVHWKTKKRPTNQKIAVKKGKNVNFEKWSSLFYKLVQCLLKFQISGSSDIWWLRKSGTNTSFLNMCIKNTREMP